MNRPHPLFFRLLLGGLAALGLLGFGILTFFLTPRTDYFWEVTQSLSHQGFAQVINNQGEGFENKYGHRRPWDASVGPQTKRFPVSRPGIIESIRFNPAGRVVVAQVEQVRLVGPEGPVVTIEPEQWHANKGFSLLEIVGEQLRLQTEPGGDTFLHADLIEPYAVPDGQGKRIGLALAAGLAGALGGGLAGWIVFLLVIRSGTKKTAYGQFGAKVGSLLRGGASRVPCPTYLIAGFATVCFVIYHLLPTMGETQKPLWVALTVTPEANDFVQLYYDLGRGFREKHSLMYPVVADERQTLQFPLPRRTIHKLRLDPLNRGGGFVIHAAQIFSEEGLRLDLLVNEPGFQNDIESIDRSRGGWHLTIPEGATDPHFHFSLDSPLVESRDWNFSVLLPGGVLLLGIFVGGFFLLRVVGLAKEGSPVGAVLLVLVVLGGIWWTSSLLRTVPVSFAMLPTQHGEARLYFDTGDGWSHRNVVKKALKPGSDEQRVTLRVPREAFPVVRLNPLSTFLIREPVHFREVSLGNQPKTNSMRSPQWIEPRDPDTLSYWLQTSDQAYLTLRETHHQIDLLVGFKPDAYEGFLGNRYLGTGARLNPSELAFVFSLWLPLGLMVSLLFPHLRRPLTGWGKSLSQAYHRRAFVENFFRRWGDPHQPNRPIHLFLILGLLAGGLMLFLTPPWQAPDEPRNFHRAYHVAEGNLMPIVEDGKAFGMLPESIPYLSGMNNHLPLNPDARVKLENQLRYFEVSLEPENRRRVDLVDTLYLSAIPYAGSASGIALAQTFGAGPFTLHYAGRLGNLVIGLLLGILILRIAPSWRYTLAVILLTPMAVFLMATNSHDTTTMALVLLLFAILLHLREVPAGSLGSRHLLWLGLLFGAILFSKLNYILLFPALLLVPIRNFPSPRHYWTGFLGAGALLGIALLGYYLYYGDKPPSTWDRPEIDRELQFLTILQYPLYFAQFLWATICLQGEWYLHLMIGIFGWLDTDPGPIVRYSWGTALIAAIILDQSRRITSFQWWERTLMILLAGGSFFAILSIFFITWTPAFATAIEGAQGRYFIPLVPLMCFALGFRMKLSIRQRKLLHCLLVMALALSLGWSCLALLLRYWAI